MLHFIRAQIDCANMPPNYSGNSGGVIQYADGSTYSSQLFYGFSSQAFIRSRTTGDWGDWYQFYTTKYKPTYSDVGAAPSSHTHDNYALLDGNKKKYVFDLTSYPNKNFYLLTFSPNQWELDCEIFNPGGGAALAYNENHLRFVWNKQGWSDAPVCLNILYSGCYTSTEITIMGLIQGN